MRGRQRRSLFGEFVQQAASVGLCRVGRADGDIVSEALAAGVTDISFWGFTDAHAYTGSPAPSR